MFTVYAIYSDTRNYLYVGLTNNLERRLHEHFQGYNKTTKPYRPFHEFYIRNMFINSMRFLTSLGMTIKLYCGKDIKRSIKITDNYRSEPVCRQADEVRNLFFTSKWPASQSGPKCSRNNTVVSRHFSISYLIEKPSTTFMESFKRSLRWSLSLSKCSRNDLPHRKTLNHLYIVLTRSLRRSLRLSKWQA